jgi:hypothetical protein
MKRLLLIGFAACAFALAPALSASAMPVATPGTLGASDAAVIQVKGGKGMDTAVGSTTAAVAIITAGLKSATTTMVGGIAIIAGTGDLVSDHSDEAASVGGLFHYKPLPSSFF